MRYQTAIAVLAIALCGCALRPAHVIAGDAPTFDADFSPDGKLLAVVDSKGVVRVVDVKTGRELARCDGYAVMRYRVPNSRPIVLSDDGSRVAFATADNAVRVWEWRTETGREFHGHPRRVTWVVVTDDGRVVSMSGGYTHHHTVTPTTRGFKETMQTTREPLTVISFDLATGRELSRWENDDAGVFFASLSGDGKVVATLGIPGMSRELAKTPKTAVPRRELSAWDAQTGARTWWKEDRGEYMAMQLELTRDGKVLYTSGGPKGPQSRGAPGMLWSIPDGNSRPAGITGARFSRDDRSLNLIVDFSREANSVLALLGLPIPAGPKPTIQIKRVDVATGKVVISRRHRVNPRTWPTGWTDDLSTFIDAESRLWRLRN